MARKKFPKGSTEGSVQDLLDLSDDEAAIVEMLIRALFAMGSDRKEIGKLLAA